MRFRYLAAVAGALVIAASVPLFRLTPQSYMPDGVDEAEFELRVEAPESANFASIDAVLRDVEADLRQMPEVRTVLATAGGGFIGGVGQGNVYVRIAPHAERYVSLTRLVKATLRGHPGEAFAGNYTQADVMNKVRRAMKKYRDVSVAVRGFPSFNLGGGNFDIDLSVSRPRPSKSSPTTPSGCASAASRSPASPASRRRSSSTSPSCA